MPAGFIAKLYRAMRAGDTASFRRLISNSQKSLLNKPAEGCFAPALISAVFCNREDYLRELLQERIPMYAIAAQRGLPTISEPYTRRCGFSAMTWLPPYANMVRKMTLALLYSREM
jgi:hypothetical protein